MTSPTHQKGQLVLDGWALFLIRDTGKRDAAAEAEVESRLGSLCCDMHACTVATLKAVRAPEWLEYLLYEIHPTRGRYKKPEARLVARECRVDLLCTSLAGTLTSSRLDRAMGGFIHQSYLELVREVAHAWGFKHKITGRRA